MNCSAFLIPPCLFEDLIWFFRLALNRNDALKVVIFSWLHYCRSIDGSAVRGQRLLSSRRAAWHGLRSPVFRKNSSGPNCIIFFSSTQELFAPFFDILISAVLLQHSVLLLSEREHKYLAQVSIYFSVFMDAESIVPVESVSGGA